MTIPSTQFWGVDSFFARVYPLNSDGSIKAVNLTPYEGLVIDGPRTFDLTPAESGLVVNIGNGRVRDTIYRAPREASRAELRVGYDQLDIIAALTGVNVLTIGELRSVGRLTNRQGSEADVALLLTQRGHDENGLTRFKTYVIPKAKCVPMDSSMNDNASEMRFTITISNSKKEVWGEPFTVEKHGFTDTGYLTWITEGVPLIVGWLADGSEDIFPFNEARPSISIGKVSVFNFISGTEITGATISVDDIDIDYVPAAQTPIIAVYEHAE